MQIENSYENRFIISKKQERNVKTIKNKSIDFLVGKPKNKSEFQNKRKSTPQNAKICILRRAHGRR